MLPDKPVTQEVLGMGDCLLGISIPMSKLSFLKNRIFNKNADFTRNNLWEIYAADTVIPSRPVLKDLRSIKCRVVRNFTFSEFAGFFKSSYKVIILFAHWQSDRVEFYDGLYYIDEILSVIPPEASKIIDLNVCKCDKLAGRIATERKNILVKWLFKELTLPFPWLRFYTYLLYYIHQNPATYLDALDATEEAFQNFFNEY
jgi:hypothetical protein